MIKKFAHGLPPILVLLVIFLFATPVSEAARMPEGDGILNLYNLHLHERLALQYRKTNGRIDKKALSEISHLLRCRQTDEVHEISPTLVELVDKIQDHFGGNEIHVISGYRSPELNENLRKHGHKVAKHSLHTQGLAMDIRIPGIATQELRNYALSLKRGGVGFYPGNGFVHVDVGRVRRW